MAAYDHIDMQNSYRCGFWIGSVSTFVGVLVLFLGVGLYFNT